MQHLQGKWICEMSELSQMKRSDVESMKSFVSRRVDKFRPPYHRNESEFPRQTVLAGTSNDDSYLIDVTGNRRYWCVQCAHIDLKRLKKDRDQLWAEATHAYKHGAQWHITDTEVYGVLTEIQERRTITDPWYADVLDELAKIDPESGISPGEMLRRLEVDPMHQHKGSAARCGQMLRNAGWTKGPITLREYLSDYLCMDFDEYLEDIEGWEGGPVQVSLEDEVPWEDWIDAWGFTKSPHAKAYRLLENLDLGAEFESPDPAGEIQFIDGPCPGSDYFAVHAVGAVSLSLLQQRLNQLDTGIQIKVAREMP